MESFNGNSYKYWVAYTANGERPDNVFYVPCSSFFEVRFVVGLLKKLDEYHGETVFDKYRAENALGSKIEIMHKSEDGTIWERSLPENFHVIKGYETITDMIDKSTVNQRISNIHFT